MRKRASLSAPRFCPMMIGAAVAKVIAPVADSACRIPTEALELWISAVIPRPIRTPMTGFSKDRNSFWNAGDSRSGRKTSSIAVIP